VAGGGEAGFACILNIKLKIENIKIEESFSLLNFSASALHASVLASARQASPAFKIED
jgi:hypothetical protein